MSLSKFTIEFTLSGVRSVIKQFIVSRPLDRICR